MTCSCTTMVDNGEAETGRMRITSAGIKPGPTWPREEAAMRMITSLRAFLLIFGALVSLGAGRVAAQDAKSDS